MKKPLYLILAGTVLLTSCRYGFRLMFGMEDETTPAESETPDETSAPVEETFPDRTAPKTEDAEPDTTAAVVTTEPFTEADWTSVLEDKAMFYNLAVKRSAAPESACLTDYLRKAEESVTKYALVDMNSSGDREMVLRLSYSNNPD